MSHHLGIGVLFLRSEIGFFFLKNLLFLLKAVPWWQLARVKVPENVWESLPALRTNGTEPQLRVLSQFPAPFCSLCMPHQTAQSPGEGSSERRLGNDSAVSGTSWQVHEEALVASLNATPSLQWSVSHGCYSIWYTSQNWPLGRQRILSTSCVYSAPFSWISAHVHSES